MQCMYKEKIFEALKKETKKKYKNFFCESTLFTSPHKEQKFREALKPTMYNYSQQISGKLDHQQGPPQPQGP